MTRRIALSFDNGPTEGVTEQVLDLLRAEDIAATFFPVATRIDSARARDVLERARDEGHRIGNHSLTHRRPMGDLTDEETTREIVEAQSVLGELATAGRLLRPWGTEGVLSRRCLNRTAVELMQRERYTCVLWNSVPRDWELTVDWVDRAMDDVARQDETLVVLHDLPTGAMDVLGRFIDRLRADDVEIAQDFPQSCVPIREGLVVGAVEGLLAPGRT